MLKKNVIKKMMEQKSKIEQKVEFLTDDQRRLVYAHASKVSKDTVEELTEGLLPIVLNSEKGLLKNELGRVIFHLQKTETLNSRIGLEKLLEASLMVAPDETYKLLESADQDAKDLAKKIKQIV